MFIVEVVIYFLFFTFLIISSYFDMRYMKIHGNIAIILGLLSLLLYASFISYLLLERILVAFGTSLAFFVIKLTKKNTIGAGDIKTLFYMSVVLGFWGLLIAVLLGCMAIFVFYVPRFIKKTMGFRSRIAFIPFLTVGSVFSFIMLEIIK